MKFEAMDKVKTDAIRILNKYKIHSYAVAHLKKLAIKSGCMFSIDYFNKPYSYVFEREGLSFKIPIEPYDS